jgi:hypothetical protein
MAARVSDMSRSTKARLWMLTRRQAVGSPTPNRWRKYPRDHREQVRQSHPASRGRRPGVDGVAQVELAGAGEDGAVPGHPGGGHAVELVDPEGDRLDQAHGVAHPHQVPGPVGREMGHGGRQRLEHGRLGAPPRRARRSRSRRSRGPPSVRALSARRSRVGATLHDAEEGLGLRTGLELARGGAGPGRPRPPCARRPPAAPPGRRAAWRRRRAPSGCRPRSVPGPPPPTPGVRRTRSPSYTEAKVTPSSSTLGPREWTW